MADIADAPLYATFALRVRALVLDSLVLSALLLVVVTLAATVHLGQTARLSLFAGVIALVVLYEPLLVSAQGRTVGQWLCNLRVVAPTANGRLPFWKAFVRWLLKGLTGLASFATMGATERHQALHDLPFAATVQVADPTKAKPHHFIHQRSAAVAAGLPSPWRRLLVIAGYLFLFLVLLSLGALMAASPACLQANRCEPGERLLVQGMNTAWLAASIAACIFGWQGRLPGARRSPRPAPALSDGPDGAA